MPTAQEYAEARDRLQTNAAVARHFGVNESTVRKAIANLRLREGLDPAVATGMASVGMESIPVGGWIKSHEKDEYGRTYSWYVRPRKEEATDTAAEIEELMRSIPAVHLKLPKEKEAKLKAVIPLNDLHAGSYAWGAETGYGDYDLTTATKRLTDWTTDLLRRMPVVDEVILLYNGDTLHANGKVPMTPAGGNMLDTDTRFFKAVNMTAAAMVVVADLAAQKHRGVRIVVKRGNHDEDSYVALLMAMKYRYRDTPTVTVEEDPSPYWAHRWGKNFWFAHHGDRVKPQDLVMKMASDHADVWGQTKHRVVFTAHLHHRAMHTFHGATWEQASCITSPDAYGAHWGDHAQLQAIIYDKELGERMRLTVKPR